MSKKDKCEITKITVRIGDQDHLLTIDQAKAIKAALETLFGQTIIERHHHHERPKYIWDWPQPYWTNNPILQSQDAPPYPFEITCDAPNSAAMLSIK